MDVEFIMEVEARAAALDAMDYFEVLRAKLKWGEYTTRRS